MINPEEENRKVLRDLADELLSKGTSVRLKASGYSMYPVVRPGNTVIIKPVEPEKLQCGMIVAWKREKDMVVHRLILAYESGGKKYFITRGDSCRSSDKPVTVDMIAGRVETIYRGHKFFRPSMIHPIPERKYRMNRFITVILAYLKKIRGIKD